MQMHHAYKKDEFYSTLTHRAGVVGYFFPLTVIYQKCLQIRGFLPAIFDGISAQNIWLIFHLIICIFRLFL